MPWTPSAEQEHYDRDWILWLALVLSSLPSNQWLYEYDLLKRLKENRN